MGHSPLGGNRFVLGLFLFAVAGFALQFLAMTPYQRIQRGVLFLGAFGALFLLSHLVRLYRGSTTAAEIPFSAISHVLAVEGGRMTRNRFVVAYEPESSTKKRYVMLPSS